MGKGARVSAGRVCARTSTGVHSLLMFRKWSSCRNAGCANAPARTGMWKWIRRGKDQDASRMEGTSSMYMYYMYTKIMIIVHRRVARCHI